MLQEEHRARHLAWEGCVNARDLGGLPARDGATIRRGALVRSECLDRLTETGRQALLAHGVRTIVDVRLPDEAAGAPYPFMGKRGFLGRRSSDGNAVRYVNVSFIVPDTYWPTGPISIADDYKRSLDRFASQVAAIAKAIADAPEGGVLVHCAAGKDRTGLVVALLLDLAGVPRDLIAADYALSSENLRERTLEWIEMVPEERAQREEEMLRMMSRPETMLEVLTHLDESYGSTEGYLLASGCRPEHLARLRARLVAEV